MDIRKLAEALRATLVPDQREQAEAYLKEVHKIIGFVPQLLQLVMSQEVDMPVRQAGAIYLKNQVTQYWDEEEGEIPTEPTPFTIHETDKQLIRDNIVQAVIAAQNPIRVQLSVCVSQIVKYDYPGRWPGIAEKVLMYLTSDQHDTWHGSLICLYQLVKNFEYKKSEDRQPLNEAMSHILPVIHRICVQLLPDASELSVTIQKQILKVFFALVQFYLPLDLISKDIFTIWMELIRQIVERPLPPECDQVDEDEKADLVWWKCKKWALHIISRCFERYGSPGNVLKEYNQFSEWYLKTFSGGIIQVLLNVLDAYRTKHFVSPRCLQLTLTYFTQAVGHAFTWKLIKPHIQAIIQDIVFPLMCHTDEDEDLWQSDPIEYIRVKYDIYEEFFSPTTAAQTLLHDAVAKRKEVLQKTMGFVMSILTTQDLNPRHKSGALHMIGSLSELLLQKKMYKDQVELMLVNHIIPEFASPHGFLRARVCWVVHCFSEVKFKNLNNLQLMLDTMRSILQVDKDLPVRIEAAIGLQKLLNEQEKAKEILSPHCRQIILDLLTLVRETENDDLTSVIQKFVCVYSDEITPLAVEITAHLAQTFAKVIESSDGESSDDKSITAMGILNTLETICTVMEEQKDILQQIEGVVVDVIGVILQHNVTEFFEEMLSLIYSLTTPQITPQMWKTLPIIYDLFQKDNVDYFTDMMPALHNYVTVDPAGFMSNPTHLEIMYNMAKTVLNGDAGEDAECHAAKLLEVILLQFKDSVENVMPLFVQLVIERLIRPVQTTELRTMCLQVILAALYCSPVLLLRILEETMLPNTNQSMTSHFLKQLINDSDCFLGLHDRKMFVLGLCTLLQLPTVTRPSALNDVAAELLPALITVFKGLKRAYECRSREDEESEDEDEEVEEELEDDDDVIDNDGDEYAEKLEKAGKEDDEDDDEDEDDAEETALEGFETTLDKEDCVVEEYQIFKTVLEGIGCSDQMWYQMLTKGLNDEHRKELEDVFRLADQKRAAEESKKIEQQGGYSFQQLQVPSTFCFGGGLS